MNFQAAVTATAAVYLARSIRLGWLDGIEADVPTAMWAESNGPGDDIHLELVSGARLEAQVKKGMRSGERLWESIKPLANFAASSPESYSVLVVGPDSSEPVRNELSQDVIRIGEGRFDGLHPIGAKLIDHFKKWKIPQQEACKRFRVIVFHGLQSDSVSILAAKAELAHLVPTESINAAWNCLYRHAGQLIEHKGRWEASDLLAIIRSANIPLTGESSSLRYAESLINWTIQTNRSFSILGTRKPCSIEDGWIPLKLQVIGSIDKPTESAAEALRRYHGTDSRAKRNEQIYFDAEYIGRFFRRTVVVAGPGLGKSTLLTKLAHVYASDGFPVLKVSLRPVVACMNGGASLRDCMLMLGLQNSGIPSHTVTGFSGWVILFDGLDECGDQHHAVAQAIAAFAEGAPGSHIVVTTRPIGYRTSALANWRHYRLEAPRMEELEKNLFRLLTIVLPQPRTQLQGVLERAEQTLAETDMQSVVSRSPLLLGMSVNLVSGGGEIGNSRTQLYENLLDLVERTENRREARTTPRTVLVRCLDMVAWELIQNPLQVPQELIKRCAKSLVEELGQPLLRVQSTVEEAIQHWEQIGIVEKVHHGPRELLTFVHKTFGEFCAARHFSAIADSECGTRVIKNHLLDPGWFDVWRFVVGLGHYTLLLAACVQRATQQLQFEPVILALKLLVEAKVKETEGTQALVSLATRAVTGADEQTAYEMAEVLVPVATKLGVDLGQEIPILMGSQQTWTRLIGWSCAIELGRKYYELSEVPTFFRAWQENLDDSLEFNLLYGLNLRVLGGKAHLQRIVFRVFPEMVAEFSDERLAEFESIVGEAERIHTAGFLEDWSRLQCKYERPNKLGKKWDLRMAASGTRFKPDGLLRAERVMSESILSALVYTGLEGLPADEIDRPLVHLSAFLAIVQFIQLPVSDFWRWTEDYDAESVREVFLIVATLAKIDNEKLSHEASIELSRIKNSKKETTFGGLLSSPNRVCIDVPECAWNSIESMVIDHEKLFSALLHPSILVVQLAEKLILGLGNLTRNEIREYLRKARGFQLDAVGCLALSLGKDEGCELILNCLDDEFVKGSEHLLNQLIERSPQWNEKVDNVIRKALLVPKERVELAEAAAQLFAVYAKQGTAVDHSILRSAYEFWVGNEKPYPVGVGVVPTSPRETLLGIMISLGLVSDEELLCHTGDVRSDVREVARDELDNRLKSSKSMRDRFVSKCIQKSLTPGVLANALDACPTFDSAQIEQIVTLLNASEPEWRLASMHILRLEYITKEEICCAISSLMSDTVGQVRRYAHTIRKKVNC